MHTPLFSVLVPAYNIESLIRQTQESALAQTIQDLEIVVVDDGSSDKTTEVVHSFTDPRIRLIHQANAGVSAARNRAIAEARGKYVAFLDGDDVWLPFHLETALRFFEAYPDIHWYSSAFEYRQHITKEDMQRTINGTPPWEVCNYFIVRMQDWTAVWTSAIVMERSYIPESLFPPGIKNGEDEMAWAKFASTQLYFGNCSAVTVYYRQRRFSASTVIMSNGPEKFTALFETAAFYSELARDRKFDRETTRSLRDFVEYAWEQSIAGGSLFRWTEFMPRTRNLQSFPLHVILRLCYWSNGMPNTFWKLVCKVCRRSGLFK